MKKLSLVLILGIFLQSNHTFTAEEQPGLLKRIGIGIINTVTPKATSLKEAQRAGKRALGYAVIGGTIIYCFKDSTAKFLGTSLGTIGCTVGANVALKGVSQFWQKQEEDIKTKEVITDALEEAAWQSIVVPISYCAIPYLAHSRIAGVPLLGRVPVINKMPIAALPIAHYYYARENGDIPEEFKSCTSFLEMWLERLAEEIFMSYFIPFNPSSCARGQQISISECVKSLAYYLPFETALKAITTYIEKRGKYHMIKMARKIKQENPKALSFKLSLPTIEAVATYNVNAFLWIDKTNDHYPGKKFIKEQIEKTLNEEYSPDKTEFGYRCEFYIDHLLNLDKEELEELVEHSFNTENGPGEHLLIKAIELLSDNWPKPETSGACSNVIPTNTTNWCTNSGAIASGFGKLISRPARSITNIIIEEITEKAAEKL